MFLSFRAQCDCLCFPALRISLSAKGRPRPKWPKNPLISRFPASTRLYRTHPPASTRLYRTHTLPPPPVYIAHTPSRLHPFLSRTPVVCLLQVRASTFAQLHACALGPKALSRAMGWPRGNALQWARLLSRAGILLQVLPGRPRFPSVAGLPYKSFIFAEIHNYWPWVVMVAQKKNTQKN